MGADDPRVDQLLEELLDSGGTPEEACRPCPELLPQVRAGWQRLRALKAEVGALFPPSGADDGAAPLAPPTTEFPRIPGYEVQEVLGHGGVGVVYKAWHQRLNRAVALKMLLAGPCARPQELERFLREAQTVAGLRHANIVHVHEAGDVDGRSYFTMEYVEGGSLASTLAGNPQPAAQAAALVATLAEAVEVAHQSGVVHRDLKPANVLLTADGTPKITDFGLARRLESGDGLTLSGVPMGTPSYMAPEQAEGKPREIGPAADIYALGAIFYETLTGRTPFRADTATETLRQVISQEPAPPSRLNSAVPRDAQTICLKCLQKDPRRRYASAAALAEDLHRFGRNEPIVARPVGLLERALKWTARNPTGAALVLTAVALIGLAIGGAVWLVGQRAERRAELRSEVAIAAAQALSLGKRFHFGEARELLREARHRLGPEGIDDVRRKADQAWDDLALAQELDTARLRAATLSAGPAIERLYEEPFANAALGRPGDDCVAVAARVRGSAVREEIVAALDDWASLTQDHARRAWLLEVARRADPNPLRDRLRQPELWNDAPALTKLVEDLPADHDQMAQLSPQLLTAVCRHLLRAGGGDALPLLSAAQTHYPQDFWLNYELAYALQAAEERDEALSYCRAALALRPKAGAVHNNLGVILLGKRRLDQAIDHFEQAIGLDPKLAAAHVNLGNALRAKGQLDEAIGHFEQATRIDPDFFLPHANLGLALYEKGQVDAAISQLQQALELNPKLTDVRHHLFACRYAAACAAVAASTGDSPLGDAAREGLRRQALDWLRANLDARANLPQDSAAVDGSLAAWQTDPSLTGVRDRGALAKLPDVERDEWQRFWSAVAALVADDPLEQGRELAARRQWTKAADSYARSLERSATDGHFWFEYAAVLVLSGDRTGYSSTCSRMIDQCGKASNVRAYHVARACTLAEGPIGDMSLARHLAETELKANARHFWSLTEQGALHYRAGRYQEAVAQFEQSLRADAKPGRAVLNWLWLALAHERLGESDDARRWLAKAEVFLDGYRDGLPLGADDATAMDLHNWLEANVLLGEAEALNRPENTR
jgi:serine/threonine-protein kinase